MVYLTKKSIHLYQQSREAARQLSDSGFWMHQIHTHISPVFHCWHLQYPGQAANCPGSCHHKELPEQHSWIIPCGHAIYGMAACEHVPIHTRQLRAGPAQEDPVSYLSRKSSIHKSFEAAKMFRDHHTLAKDAEWTLKPDHCQCALW